MEWFLLFLPFSLGIYFGYLWYPFMGILPGGVIGLAAGMVLFFLAKDVKEKRIEPVGFSIGLAVFMVSLFSGNYILSEIISKDVLAISIGRTVILVVSLISAWIISKKVELSRFRAGELSSNYGSFVFDTSVLLDEKVLDLFDVGLFNGKIIVPQFVLIEMQKLADSSDEEKKEKGRRGFEIVEKIKELKDVKLIIDDTITYENGKVDEEIVNLARKFSGRVVTLDYNLTKVAQLQGVKVLNLNHLAEILKPTLLPGQRVVLQIIRHGKNKEQGIGFTEDGTMIVVEDGGKNVGSQREVVITNILRTNAGKLLFGRINPKS